MKFYAINRIKFNLISLACFRFGAPYNYFYNGESETAQIPELTLLNNNESV